MNIEKLIYISKFPKILNYRPYSTDQPLSFHLVFFRTSTNREKTTTTFIFNIEMGGNGKHKSIPHQESIADLRDNSLNLFCGLHWNRPHYSFQTCHFLFFKSGQDATTALVGHM